MGREKKNSIAARSRSTTFKDSPMNLWATATPSLVCASPRRPNHKPFHMNNYNIQTPFIPPLYDWRPYFPMTRQVKRMKSKQSDNSWHYFILEVQSLFFRVSAWNQSSTNVKQWVMITLYNSVLYLSTVLEIQYFVLYAQITGEFPNLGAVVMVDLGLQHNYGILFLP